MGCGHKVVSVLGHILASLLLSFYLLRMIILSCLPTCLDTFNLIVAHNFLSKRHQATCWIWLTHSTLLRKYVLAIRPASLWAHKNLLGYGATSDLDSQHLLSSRTIVALFTLTASNEVTFQLEVDLCEVLPLAHNWPNIFATQLLHCGWNMHQWSLVIVVAYLGRRPTQFKCHLRGLLVTRTTIPTQSHCVLLAFKGWSQRNLGLHVVILLWLRWRFPANSCISYDLATTSAHATPCMYCFNLIITRI